MVDLVPDFRGATAETVKKAFEILLRDPKVKSIFINIFGGMCHAAVDSIAA
jgi:succinyl-CoA synthetase beta subunit